MSYQNYRTENIKKALLFLKNIRLNINFLTFFYVYRNSHPEMFCRKDARKTFAKFIGKHLCQSLFFNEVVAP